MRPASNDPTVDPILGKREMCASHGRTLEDSDSREAGKTPLPESYGHCLSCLVAQSTPAVLVASTIAIEWAQRAGWRPAVAYALPGTEGRPSGLGARAPPYAATIAQV